MNARTFLLPTLLLAACSQSDAVGDKASETALGTGTGGGPSANVTPAYLKGDWCYSHVIAGDERSDEMMTYAFSEGGTLLYQVNPTTPVEMPGSYTIVDGHLKIMPTLKFFDFTVESIDPDAMVLKMAYGLTFWERGACKQ